jgi:hypothetical protein
MSPPRWLPETPASRLEHKRLGRGIELAALAEQLRADGIGLEFLTDELRGRCSSGTKSHA